MEDHWPDLGHIRKFELEWDPGTGRLVRMNAQPDEVEQAINAAKQIEGWMREVIDAPAPPPQDARAQASKDRASERAPTISEAFTDWSVARRRSGKWSENTLKYTYEPDLKVFRELIGEPMPSSGSGSSGADQIFDLELSQLTASRMEQFIRSFWSYPARQGQRESVTTARELLARGGPAQSNANVYKRLSHIRQFINFCVEKEWVDRRVLKELDLVIAEDSERNRRKQAATVTPGGLATSDGYVSFTDEDLKRLFGPRFDLHARNSPERYWIPLISLYSGLRVGEISALEVGDFVTIDGIDCIKVVPHDPLSADVGPTRVKTAASLRDVPLHPQLIELGLQEFVAQRRKAGKRHLWDGLSWSDKGGYGRYPSRDFKILSTAADVYVKRRKVFHSFRSTFSQAIERTGLELEHIDRLLGHELKSIRGNSYSRTETGTAVPIALIHQALCKVAFPIQIRPWPAFCAAGSRGATAHRKLPAVRRIK